MQKKGNEITMKKIVVFLLLIVMTVSLFGCNKEGSSEGGFINSITHKKQNVQNDGELTNDSILMVIGNRAVTYKEALIYIYQLREEYEPSFGTEIWDYELQEGKTFEDNAKEELIKDLTQLKIICQEAEKQELFLTDDEKIEITEQAKNYVAGITKEDQETYSITEELIQQIYEENQIASKMFDITTNEINTDISDEEARQWKIEYLMIMTNGEDKYGNTVNLNENEKKEALKKAKSLRKKATEVENFKNFADANTDDTEVEVVFGVDDKPVEFGDDAMKLKTGEVSKVITADSGYYIVYCVSDFDEEETLNKKEEIILKNQNEEFERIYKEWSEQYEIEVSSLWSQIKFVQ